MSLILKWLKENGIECQYIDKRTDKYIKIILETGCIWVNGFGKEMLYDKEITIHKDTYKNYTVSECVGYNLFHTLAKSTKQDRIIKALEERFLQATSAGRKGLYDEDKLHRNKV